jgi:single-strand DNA-binding protein
MTSLNRATLIGRVGRDPEVSYTKLGKKIIKLSIATSEPWRDKATGEKKEKTEWHNIIIFNEAIANVVDQYVRKGSFIYIEGTIRTNEYTDKDGIQKKATQIVLDGYNCQLKLLGGRNNNDDDNDAIEQPDTGKTAVAIDDISDDVPF